MWFVTARLVRPQHTVNRDADTRILNKENYLLKKIEIMSRGFSIIYIYIYIDGYIIYI